MIKAVIGSHYGDEGKGLVTDFLTRNSAKNLVIRHNGGAQAGHTVEIDGKRFVFHELSSGSFNGADTYWAKTFMPDMYKLDEEILDFYNVSGITPTVYVNSQTCITIIDDVLINMLLETSRGESRHGSCGMGINESDLRNKAGFKLTFDDLNSFDLDSLFNCLKSIRKNYSLRRLSDLSLSHLVSNEYISLLNSDDVLFNFSRKVLENLKYVKIIDNEKTLFNEYDNLVFEGAQGLRLDSEYDDNWPHVTSSRTGLTNVYEILLDNGMTLDEVIYVSRSYCTKHGAGNFQNELNDWPFGDLPIDKTNIHNEWQGSLRFGHFNTFNDYIRPILNDLNSVNLDSMCSLFITHLNETENNILFNEKCSINDFIKRLETHPSFNKLYLSYSNIVTENSLNTVDI